MFLALLGIGAVPATAQENTNIIVAAEYFIDTDPGQGLATALPPKDGSYDSLDESADFEITTPPTLPLGVHHLYVRMKSAQGIWSTPIKQMFIVDGPKSILAAEYFIDDPGRPAGAGTPLTMAPGMGTDKLLEALEIPTTGLSVGIHTVYVRAKDQDSIWGPARAYSFQVLPPPVVAAAEYYIGPTNDPAATNWQAMTAQLGFDFLTPEVLVEGLIDTKTMARGTYRVWVRGKDQDGRVTSAPASAEFEVAKEFPLLNIVPDQLARAGSAITIRPSLQNSITGTFLPFQVPAGMTVNSATGEIQWTIPANEPPGEKTVNVIFDDGSAPSLRLIYTFKVVVDSATEPLGPALVSTKALRVSGHADLVFSKPLEQFSAENIENYRVNGVRPTAAQLGADGRTVTLWSPSVSEEDFQVTVLNVQDTLGRPLVSAGTPVTGNIVPMLAKNFSGSSAAGAAFARSDNAVDLKGAGAGFTGQSDSGNFVYEELIGNFDIQVQLRSFTVSDYLSSAGLVARASLAPGAMSVAALWRPLGSNSLGSSTIFGFARVIYARTNSGAAKPIDATGSGAAGTWLRLQRLGDEIKVMSSSNGLAFIDWQTIIADFPDKMLVGLATASGLASGPESHAQFANYTYNFPAITENPVSQRIPVGGSAVFGVKARSTDPITYQWRRNNVPLAGQNQSTLRIPSVAIADAGQYFVSLGSLNQSATVTLEIGGLAGGIKGDVAPRSNGDGLVGVSDWVQTARFVVKLDTASSGEVYRADTAPRASGGDGILTVMDMVQTARYVVGLDARPADRKAHNEFIPTRTLQISSVTVGQAGVVELPVVLKAASGENAIGFSLSYKPKLARLKSVRLGDAFAQGTLYINNNADVGKAGVVLGLPVNASLPPGEARICWLNFEVLSGAEPIDIQFTDDPVRRELIDAEVNPLPTIYEPGAITISDDLQQTQLVRSGVGSFELTFPTVSGRTYRIDTSLDLEHWQSWKQWQSALNFERISIPISQATGAFFYRVSFVP